MSGDKEGRKRASWDDPDVDPAEAFRTIHEEEPKAWRENQQPYEVYLPDRLLRAIKQHEGDA